MESLDEIEVEAELSPEVPSSETAHDEKEAAVDADPPAETFESAAQEPEVSSDVSQEIEQDTAEPESEQTDSHEEPNTSLDTEAAPVDTDLLNESATEEQDSVVEASEAATTATDVGDAEPALVGDESVSEDASATFTAEELEPQIGEILESMGDVQPTAPRRVLGASAQGPAAGGLVDNQPAPSAPASGVDIDWLASELDQLLNPDAQDSASKDQPASPQTDDASIDGAAEQDDPTPELPDQESAPSDESSSEVEASLSTLPESDDGPGLDENESEPVAVVSSIDAQESATTQQEIAPTEPIDAVISNGDGSSDDNESSGSADANLDESMGQLDDVVQPEVEASTVPTNAPKETTEAVAADEPPQETIVQAIESPPPSAIDAIEPDAPASSADDELAEMTAQLDELLDADDDSSRRESPIDVPEEAPAMIDSAEPPGETEAVTESIEAEPATTADAPSPDEGLGEIDRSLADEVDELLHGVAGSPKDAANDDLGEPTAPAGDSEPQIDPSAVQSEDSTSSEAFDEAAAATDPSGEEADEDMGDPAALDSETAAETETELTMDAQEPAEAEAQSEADTSNEFADEPDPESAPEAQVESEPPSQDGAEPEPASAKDDGEDPRASQTEELKEAAVATVRFARLHSAVQRIEPIAVPVLRRVNYPLRYVPQNLRPIVDWIALSLLFWVPIVWAIALLAG